MSIIDKEEIIQVALGLIVHAGDAKSLAQQAIQASNEYDFSRAEELLSQANEELKSAHGIQTKTVQAEANGDSCEITVLLIHAQDHLAMAMSAIDVAKQMMKLNKKIFDLEQKVNNL